jgi:hypothetical protein
VRKVTIPKLYIWARRKGWFRDLLNIDFILMQFFQIGEYKKSNKGQLLMPPIEIMIDSDAVKRCDERCELISLFNTECFEIFIKKKCLGERNSAFRWNAFYPLYDLYLCDSEEIYRDSISQYLTTWLSLYLLDKQSNQFCWYDMADSFRLMLIIDILANKDYDSILTNKQRKILIFGAKKHYKLVSKHHFAAIGNHRIFQLVASIKYNEFIGSELGKITYISLLTHFREKQFGCDYVHLEHSPEYHIWAAILFSKIFGKYIPISTEELKVQQSVIFSRYLFCSNGHIPLIGDSGLEHAKRYAELVKLDERNNEFFYVKDSGYIIDGNDEKGYYFICSYKANSKIHKHFDSGSYELTLNGKKIITDSGKYSYTPSQLSSSIREASAHNVFIMNNILVHNVLSYEVEKIIQKSNIKVVCLTGSHKYKQHSRIFFIIDNGLIILDICGDDTADCKSIINFDHGVIPEQCFNPLIGIVNVEITSSIISRYYLDTESIYRLTLTVESISAYSLSATEILNFKYQRQEVTFMHNNIDYNFDLRECRNA